jgi:hypothetical protein
LCDLRALYRRRSGLEVFIRVDSIAQHHATMSLRRYESLKSSAIRMLTKYGFGEGGLGVGGTAIAAAAKQRTEEEILENLNVQERDAGGLTPMQRVQRFFWVWLFTCHLACHETAAIGGWDHAGAWAVAVDLQEWYYFAVVSQCLVTYIALLQLYIDFIFG